MAALRCFGSRSLFHGSDEAGLIDQPAAYRNGLHPAPGLSEKDIAQVRLFYPPLQSVMPQLRRLEPQRLALEPAGQANFAVIPEASGKYRFRTFGDSDTVMVLFEEDGGELRYLTGDDDSGTDRNASFEVRLLQGRRYVLRIRPYYNTASGHTLLFFW
jgi:hypothetical protein